MISGDSKFVLTRTHVHMFPHTHTTRISKWKRDREHTHNSPNGGRDQGKRKDHLASSNLFRRCRQLGDSSGDLESLSL